MPTDIHKYVYSQNDMYPISLEIKASLFETPQYYTMKVIWILYTSYEIQIISPLKEDVYKGSSKNLAN
jgi:hypothetical protein